MLERPDLLALHEPLEGIAYNGPLAIGQRVFETPPALLAWLLDEAFENVFMKETLAPRVIGHVHSSARFLAEARHGFLIRRPAEIAASFLALEGDLRIHDTGVESLYGLYRAVVDAGGHAPVVIDSDELVSRPEATMRAYCGAVGLPFLADALRWESGVQPEWEHTARWHEDASASTGFYQPDTADRHSLETHPEVLRFIERHQPFYERLRAERLQIDRPA